jgi:hypothetical protein
MSLFTKHLLQADSGYNAWRETLGARAKATSAVE